MHYLTMDEIKRLIKEIPVQRQKLMIKVGLLHGMRISEILSLTKEDIKDGYINIQRLKGSLRTIQPYVKHPDPELDESKELQKLYSILQTGELLFPMTRSGAYKLMQRAGKRAGLPSHKLHPHVLKHSCAMVAVKKMNLPELQRYLGHKNLSSTGEYLKQDDEAASKAFAGVFA